MAKIPGGIGAALGGAAVAGIKKAKEGGTGKEITQAAVEGAGVPSFGGRRDKAVGAVYDATAPIVRNAVNSAAQQIRNRTSEFLQGRGTPPAIGQKDPNA
jgi:hypothetical protein